MGIIIIYLMCYGLARYPELTGQMLLAMIIYVCLFYMIWRLILVDHDTWQCFYNDKSEYYRATGVTRRDVLKDKGIRGEFYAYVLSKKLKTPHRTLYNVCIPMPNGNFQEIDAIIIGRQGIYVLECKNRAGAFEGTAQSEIWIQYIGRQEHEVKNIYQQNQEHIYALDCFLKSKNVLVEAELYYKNIILTNGDFYLDYHGFPPDFTFGDIFSLEEQISGAEAGQNVLIGELLMDHIYETLLPYALNGKEKKAQMVDERERRSQGKEFSRGGYRYYQFMGERVIPGVIEAENPVLRRDNIYTQVKVDIEGTAVPLWWTVPDIEYQERR